MYVQYNKKTGKVKAVNDSELSEVEESKADNLGIEPISVARLPKESITTPITETFVDDIDNPTKTISDLKKAKDRTRETVKNKAHALLKPTDWYIIRKQEIGTEIPQDIVEYREKVRSVENTTTSKITDATTVEDVRSIEADWPVKPEV